MNKEAVPKDHEPSDLDLIQAFQKGDDSVFEVLIKRYELRLFNSVLGMIQNQHEAEDIFQDILVKIYKKLKDFRGDSKFFTWVYRIGVNTTWDHLRKKKRRPAFSLDAAIEEKRISPKKLKSNQPEPRAEADLDERVMLLKKAMNRLKPKHRIILQLKEVDGYSYQEIAGILKCSIGTVESRLFRARANLKKELETMLKK